jgi:hypothetical protein
VIAAVVLSWLLFAPNRSYSEHMPNDDDPVALELSTLGEKGDTIARARRQALEILQNGNACTAWFQEADPAAAEVFRSLHLGLEIKGPSYIYASKDNGGVQLFKHPWAAMAMEYGGRNSIVLLNVNGAFFKRASIVMQLDTEGMPSRVAGMRELVIASYDGNTPEAQITILLHELGHITGRLPEDGDSWDGRSSRNTSELLQHCKAEIFAVSRNSLRGQARGTISTSKPKQENWP